ncbi:MAG: DMT family transporter [Candidatus Saccharicenans sp.]|nr:DMT family transporter [Candidatus Saccharicenans sp.]
MKTKTRALFQIHLAVLFFGFPGVIGKILPLSPLELTWFRVLLASVGLLLILVIEKTKPLVAGTGPKILLFISGILLAFHWTAFFLSVQLSTVAVGLLSYSTFPIFTVFLEPWLLGVKFKNSYLAFALICFLGVGLMVPEFNPGNRIFLGIIWGTLAGLSFAFLTIINRKLSPEHPGPVLAFYQDLLAAIFLLPLVFSRPVSWSFSLDRILWLLFLGLVCTAGAHTLFISGLKFLEARLSSLISTLEPVYGIVLGYIFLHEIPAARTILGGLLILCSVLMLSLRRD